MKNSEFIALTIANSSRTANIRAYTKPWYTGASRIPDHMSKQIGRIISLLQDIINKGLICKKDQYLLIYNFQPLHINSNAYLCSLDMVTKPVSQLMITNDNSGQPIQLVANCTPGEVMNNTKGLIMLELISEAEAIEDELEPPISYGNYNSYQAQCCVVAITSQYSIKNIEDIFMGMHDSENMVQEGIAFDTILEASKFLENKNELGKYILEISCAKENIEDYKKEGLSKITIKLIEFFSKKVFINPSLSDQRKYEEVREKEELEELFKASSSENSQKGLAENEQNREQLLESAASPLLSFSKKLQISSNNERSRVEGSPVEHLSTGKPKS